jgi:hypothetical protein
MIFIEDPYYINKNLIGIPNNLILEWKAAKKNHDELNDKINSINNDYILEEYLEALKKYMLLNKRVLDLLKTK